MKRDVVDALFSIVVKRYAVEKPNTHLSNDMLNGIWYSLQGVLNQQGEEAAFHYARTAKLLPRQKYGGVKRGYS